MRLADSSAKVTQNHTTGFVLQGPQFFRESALGGAAMVPQLSSVFTKSCSVSTTRAVVRTGTRNTVRCEGKWIKRQRLVRLVYSLSRIIKTTCDWRAVPAARQGAVIQSGPLMSYESDEQSTSKTAGTHEPKGVRAGDDLSPRGHGG